MNKVLPFIALAVLLLAPIASQLAFAGAPTENDCDDGIDNDQDGFTDGDDLDCQIILNPVPQGLPELPGLPGPDPVPILGDFTCYDPFIMPDDHGVAPSEFVDLDDQFGPMEQVAVRELQSVCTSVRKFIDQEQANENPVIPNQHFTCYDIDGPPTGETVVLRDQFGVSFHEVLEPIELCATASKLEIGGGAFASQTDTHYKCYNIRGNDPTVNVGLTDQFSGGNNYDVGEPTKLCAPVIKTDSAGTEYEPATRDHLKCYVLTAITTPVISNSQYRLFDQFFPNPPNDPPIDIQIREPPLELCVTASKIHWPPEDNGNGGNGHDVIGGEIIPIESTSLLLAGVQSFSWMLPVTLSVLGIGLFAVSRKSEN